MDTTYLCTMSMLFLSYLFVTAGWQKFSDNGFLRKTITEYQVLPPRWSSPVARVLPTAELCTGAGLLIPPIHNVAAVSACVLLLSYSVAIATNILRGRRDLNCGCSGPNAEQVVSRGLLARNGFLIGLALALLYTPISQRPPLDITGFFFAALSAVFGALLYHIFNQMLANQHKLQRINDHG